MRIPFDSANIARVKSLLHAASLFAFEDIVAKLAMAPGPGATALTSASLTVNHKGAPIGRLQVAFTLKALRQHADLEIMGPVTFAHCIERYCRELFNEQSRPSELGAEAFALDVFTDTASHRLPEGGCWSLELSGTMSYIASARHKKIPAVSILENDEPEFWWRSSWLKEFFGRRYDHVFQSAVYGNLREVFGEHKDMLKTPAELKVPSLEWKRIQHTGWLTVNMDTSIEPIAVEGDGLSMRLPEDVVQSGFEKDKYAVGLDLYRALQEQLAYALPELWRNPKRIHKMKGALSSRLVNLNGEEKDKPLSLVHLSALIRPSVRIDDRPRLYICSEMGAVYLTDATSSSLPLDCLLQRINIRDYVVVNHLDPQCEITPAVLDRLGDVELVPATETQKTLGPNDLIVSVDSGSFKWMKEEASKLPELPRWATPAGFLESRSCRIYHEHGSSVESKLNDCR